MKDMISERLIQLSSAKESMMIIDDIMEDWEVSQAILEKNAFDAINISDKVLDLSKEGHNLIGRLQESYSCCCASLCPEDEKILSEILSQVTTVFKSVFNASVKISEISHNIEKESSHQKEIKDGLEQAVGTITEGIDAAIACAEFVLAEIVS